MLEKLEVEYAGRFKLAKIDSDQQQQLAAACSASAAFPPACCFEDGQPVDGFMGAQPEGQVRAFLDKHVPKRRRAGGRG